jgi:DNA-binding NtrC family response regulator
MLEELGEFIPTSRAGVATCPGDGCDVDTLLSAARSAAESAPAGTARVAAEAATRLSLEGRSILVADPAMVRLFDLIQRLAKSELPILVTGETGAGKENAAFAVHYFSPRRSRPFVALNCAALQDTLMESELFGYERGAFSGATHSKPGLLESAAGGTVFLDEVGELSASAQSKLLRALEVKKITRLGDVREREIDIRIVAATNRNLVEEVEQKRFRQDLFFRLTAATVVLPPLRDRPREIALLSQTFLGRACERAGRAPMIITASAMQKLCSYKWPGNVRELRNAMDYVAAAVPEPLLEVWHLPESISGKRTPRREPPSTAPASTISDAPVQALADTIETQITFRPLADEIRELERQRIKEALKAAGGVRKHAAELIGMPLRTFVLRLKQHGLGQNQDAGDAGAEAEGPAS